MGSVGFPERLKLLAIAKSATRIGIGCIILLLAKGEKDCFWQSSSLRKQTLNYWTLITLQKIIIITTFIHFFSVLVYKLDYSDQSHCFSMQKANDFPIIVLSIPTRLFIRSVILNTYVLLYCIFAMTIPSASVYRVRTYVASGFMDAMKTTLVFSGWLYHLTA